MEDILNRNIFCDTELHKLSPDYYPPDITLRMQVRRTMVRDTHNHGNNRPSSVQRKTIKKTKDNFRILNDITKIRNGLQKIDLKNRLLLNKAVKSKVFAENTDILLKEFKDDNNLFDTLDDTKDIVLNNDAGFKISNKIVPRKNTQYNLKNSKLHVNVNNNTEFNDENYEVCDDNNILHIKCRTIYKITSDDTQQTLSNQEMIDYTESSTHERYKNYDRIENCDQAIQMTELQTLLINMAISSKPTNQDCEIVEISDNVDNVESDVSNVKYQESIGDTFNFLSINPIRVEINDRRKLLIMKYVKKWQNYVNRRKEYLNQQKQEALNKFFDKLEKKKGNLNNKDPTNKAKLQVKDFITYEHRYKVQKHIIALQRAKLEEQNRMIEDLKYNKIVEASQQSVEAMKDQVRKTYYEMDKQLKPKLKILSNELKINEIEEPSLVLHCLKVPQFLQRMEKRAREREEKHAMIRERRRQMEEERIKMKQQAEIEKAQMDKEERLKRLKEMKEKRIKDRMESIRRKRYVERIRALTIMAEIHYEKNLVIKYGINPWKKLVEIKRDKMEKAKMHYRFQLKKNCFYHWMWYTEDKWFDRNYKAEEFYKKKILNIVFRAFRENHHDLAIKKQVADDYYDLYVIQLVFRKFREGIRIQKKEYEFKWQAAVLYNNRNLQFRMFVCWRSLPAINALKREQEARKARWRQKVLQVVPDYLPPED